MKTTTLTTEEFITRSMAGERFMESGDIYYFNRNTGAEDPIPFRILWGSGSDKPIRGLWGNFDGKTIFEIVEPEPKIERRWRWRKDEPLSTIETSYMTEEVAERYDYIKDGYYKVENCYVDVEMR